jgi:hypothetical protein
MSSRMLTATWSRRSSPGGPRTPPGAPPEEAQVALRAIGALAKEALAEAEPEAHKHRASE